MAFFTGGYGDVGGGYENPLGKNAPSWKGDYDWAGANKYGFKPLSGGGFNTEKFGKMASTFASLFDKARSRRGYDPDDYMGGFRGGQIGGGSGGQLLDNLSVVYPQQIGPTFIPGAPARSGGIGDIFSGALSGAGAGSSFGPWGALGGAVLGGIGGAFG